MERRASVTVILLRILAVLAFFFIPTCLARLNMFLPMRGVIGMTGLAVGGLLFLAELIKRNQESVDDQLEYDEKAKATGDPFAGDREMARYQDQAAKKLRQRK
jgi:hypothetical protein